MLSETVRETKHFDGFDVGGFDDGLAFAVFFEVLFVAAGDGRDFGDDFFAEAEEDVGVGLFEDVAVDVFGVLGDHEEAEFIFGPCLTASRARLTMYCSRRVVRVGDVVVGFVDGDEEWRVFDVRIGIVVVDLVVGNAGEYEKVGELFQLVCECIENLRFVAPGSVCQHVLRVGGNRFPRDRFDITFVSKLSVRDLVRFNVQYFLTQELKDFQPVFNRFVL